MSLPKGAAKEGVFYELDYPPYVVRITETSGGKLQLIASGEEHDQGIRQTSTTTSTPGMLCPAQTQETAGAWRIWNQGIPDISGKVLDKFSGFCASYLNDRFRACLWP